jgi:hypothetical protein
MTVKQLRQSLEKYHDDLKVFQDGIEIKAVRITAIDAKYPPTVVVRLIRNDESRGPKEWVRS